MLKKNGTWFIVLLLGVAFLFGISFSSLPKFHRGSRENAHSDSKGIAWQYSLQNALKTASATHRLVMVDFYADWCTYCKQMEATTYQDPSVIQLSKQFIFTKVNVDEQQALAEQFKVDGLPTLVFIKPSTGSSKRFEGYADAKTLALEMTKFASLR